MKINIGNLIFQLLPIAKRQPRRRAVLEGFTDLYTIWDAYWNWQCRISRIIMCTPRVCALERYLRDVFECEDIYIIDGRSGRIAVAMRSEKLNNRLVIGRRDSGEAKQFIQINIEASEIVDYTVIAPKSIDTAMLLAELNRFNPALKTFKIK